jgi:glycosyltransferase involved in cell wall biosynthesis/predicted SAM-dependent methyltransferase
MLSLAIIVKDEEKNITRLLDSVQGLYDELIIVDTGSTDRTVELAHRYTPHVHHFTWVNDFSKARNFSFSKCTNPWIMWLDADDVLKAEDVQIIRSEFLKNHIRLDLDYMLINYHYLVEPSTIHGTAKATQLRERIIRREKARWVGRCHEHIAVVWGRTHAISGAAVWHLRDEEDRAADANRNIELMILEAQDRPTDRSFFYLGNEYANVGRTEEAIVSYKRALDISTHINTKFQACYKIAQSLQGQLKTDEAIKWYMKALSHQVDYREPILGLASIYMERKDFTKAAFWLEAASQVDEPKHPEMVVFKPNYSSVTYDMLAKARFGLSQFDKAIEASEELYRITRQPNILSDIASSRESLRNAYKRPEGVTKLNLGCGDKPIEGFINVDLFEQPGVDEVFSLDVIPYADYSVDEIVSVHSLEHIPRPRAEAAIREWARVLKKGGKLSLKVPDLEECCRLFVERPEEQEPWYQHTIYGVQDFRDAHDAPFKDKINFGQIHYTGFTERRLRRLLTEAGFIIDDMHKYDGFRTPSLSVEAHLPAIPENQKKRIAFINNTLNPKYLSYGDHWEDAFRATGHDLDVFKYEQVGSLPSGYDLYFFIEANGRYDVASIPNISPKVLYVQDDLRPGELDCFDVIATPDTEKLHKWEVEGRTCIFLTNDSHIDKVNTLLSLNLASALVPELVPEVDHLGFSDLIPVIAGSKVVEIRSPKPAVSSIVDIIIPSYKNVEYLKLTISSVKRNSPEANIIVVNSGDDPATRAYLRSIHTEIVLIDSFERLSFSQAVNKGLRSSTRDVVILNNDTIVGKNWLAPLQNSPFDITNPFSNCDKGWIHNRSIQSNGVELEPNMFLGSVDPDQIMDLSSPYDDNVSRHQPKQAWVAFYATYIKREVIDQTGYLDEEFINGGEDYDFCRRAGKHGFTCGHTFSSFVFHYGGKTRKLSEDENYQQHHAEDKLNNEFMKLKDRTTVAIYAGQAWEPWTIDSINTTGIGGSETCAAMLAKGFAERGYRSILFGDCEGQEGLKDGVEYVHHTRYNAWKDVNHIDYMISSRKMSPLGHKVSNTKNYVWSHDIFIPECMYNYPPHADKVTKFICLSPWHVGFFHDHHKVNTSQIHIQGNGLDVSRYDARKTVQKDPHRLIYSSSPDRGLLTLLQMFPGWKKEFPQLSLHIFYGFDNWKKAIQQRNNPEEVKHLQGIEQLIEQPGVYYHGRISQERLAKEQMKSSIWAYPTTFTETFCITSTECMLAGAVPVCTTVAALKTTVPDGCGVKVDTPWGVSDAVLDLLRHPEKQQQYRIRGEKHVLENCNWNKIVQNWVDMFETT